MKLDIRIYADGVFWRGGAGIEIAEPFVQAFEKIGVCDEPMLTVFEPASVVRHSVKHRKVIKLREDAAKEIAETLTQHLIKEMEKYDTTNGYDNPNNVEG